ncbi:MAG: alkaline phosphatase D family protein [Myxococcales bacterium]|nr:alkaline phosphatase D family protein [Myxococcales bacterium]
MARFSRRAFVRLLGLGAGSAFVSSTAACSGDKDGTTETGPDGTPNMGSFQHGVASGDPQTDRVILWTRFSPDVDGEVDVRWQVATDEAFTDVVIDDAGTTDASRDYTVKVDAIDLSPGTTYHYRFVVGDQTSPTGTARTLPTGSPDQVRFVVFSCSNYPAGYFHVYAEAASVPDVDCALHLGDYIYEYGEGGYATQDAEALGRQPLPAHEILSLEDYRTRYAQYRTDPDLQALHAAMPFICVWDDHEVANDTYDGGAENHDEDEGPFADRLMVALQAYAEWMPVRPPVDEDITSIQRSFQFGDLVNLIMLDTRLVGREEQYTLADFINPDTGRFIGAKYDAAISDPTRTLLGADQLDWLLTELNDTATWQVLGQQVLMGTMELPLAVLPPDLSDPSSAPLTFDEYILLVTVFFINQRDQAGDDTLTKEELALLDDNRQFLTDNVNWLLARNVPYNLDAWDGYPTERRTVLETAQKNGTNLVVLAGDTHNAWANNLLLDEAPVGVEFATAGVSSPGLEDFLGLTAAEDPGAAAVAFEGGLPQLVTNLKFSNLLERGFMTVTFTPTDVTADWTFIDSVKQADYQVMTDRGRTITVPVGVNEIIEPKGKGE